MKYIILELIILGIFLFPVFSSYADIEPQGFPFSEYSKNPINLILKYADDTKTALRIADCESKLGLYRKNWEGSSAEGLFMFMPSTWNAYCSGSIKDDKAQIICFNKLYKIHPDWWVC